ncbi:DUF4124 domain-containing protein [Ideonella sp. YS5]|uniref:DUF4124 domain-containing protein n=1 Tax=Ideonella sp. YS5 TaxID=3453714 RepID=UPI003EEBD85F
MQYKATPFRSLGRLGLLALTLALAAGAANAQSIWKWRDKDGRVQVSDRPPPMEVPEKDILQRPHGARAPMAAASDAPMGAESASGVDPALEAKKNKALADKAAADKARLAADKARSDQVKLENCQRARNQLTALEGGQRVARMNDKGEREVLDDAGRAAEIARTRQIADANCQ